MTDIEKRIKDEFGIQVGDTVRFKKSPYDQDWDGVPWVLGSIKMVENSQIEFASEDREWLNYVVVFSDGRISDNDIHIEKI